MINYSKHVGQDIWISYLEHRALRLGRLEEVFKDQTKNKECLKVNFGDKERIVSGDEVLQFLPVDSLADENTQYYYVMFIYENSCFDNVHYYISHDHSVQSGDYVLLWDDDTVGKVVRTGFFTKEEAPYPVEKTWYIKKVLR